MDLLINQTTKDLAFVDDDLQLVTGVEEIRQRVLIRLRFFFQEWVLNRNAGTKWYELVFRKGVDKFAIDQHLRKVVTDTEGIKKILSWTSEIVGREYTVNFKAQTDDNEPLEISSDEIQV